MEYIISALWFALECVAFFLFASAFLPYRYNSKRTILTALCVCVLSLLNQSLPIPSLVHRLCALVFGLCLIVFLFKGRLEQRIFIGLLDYILITESMMSEDVRKRELAPLQSIRDNYEKIVLSLEPGLDASYDGIKSENLIEWLLRE